MGLPHASEHQTGLCDILHVSAKCHTLCISGVLLFNLIVVGPTIRNVA